jgi:hypothetical protein
MTKRFHVFAPTKAGTTLGTTAAIANRLQTHANLPKNSHEGAKLQ